MFDKDIDITVSKDSDWLIRTTNRHVFGPYTKNQIEELVKSKKIFLLDELSHKGESWETVKNIKEFKDLALDGASYEYEEDTVNLNEVESQEIFDNVSLDTATKKQEQRTNTSYQPPVFDLKTLIKKKKITKKFIYSSISVFLLILLTSLYFYGYKSGEDLKVSNTDLVNSNFDKIFLKARKYEEAGFYNIAYAEYKKCLQLNSKDINSMLSELSIRAIFFNDYKNVSNEINELFALTNTGQIKSLDTQSDIINLQGIVYYLNSDYENALSSFNQSMLLRPSQSHIYHNIGMTLLKQNKLEQAASYFNKAKKLASNIYISSFYEALILLRLYKYKDAYNIFSDLVIQESNSRINYVFAAYTKFLSKDAQSANELIEKSINIEPFYNQNHFFPISYIIDTKMFTGINETQEMLSAFKDNKYLKQLLVLLYLENANVENAISFIGKEKINNFTIEAIARFYNSDYLESKKLLDKALEIDYSDTLAHLYLGKINFFENNLSQALNNFTKAQANTETMSLEAMVLLGDVYDKFGKTEKAIELWKKVVSIDNRYKPAWHRILFKENGKTL